MEKVNFKDVFLEELSKYDQEEASTKVAKSFVSNEFRYYFNHYNKVESKAYDAFCATCVLDSYSETFDRHIKSIPNDLNNISIKQIRSIGHNLRHVLNQYV